MMGVTAGLGRAVADAVELGSTVDVVVGLGTVETVRLGSIVDEAGELDGAVGDAGRPVVGVLLTCPLHPANANTASATSTPTRR